jgi:hypothetical protein
MVQLLEGEQTTKYRIKNRNVNHRIGDFLLKGWWVLLLPGIENIAFRTEVFESGDLCFLQILARKGRFQILNDVIFWYLCRCICLAFFDMLSLILLRIKTFEESTVLSING